MDANELAERIQIRREAWDAYTKEQQHVMYRLVSLHGSVEDPVCPGFSILDRAQGLMQGLCRLDQQYTLY